jgi:hypothetical protein
LREHDRRQRQKKTASTRARAIARSQDKAHVKAECALRDNPTLGRYLRTTPTGRLRIDRQEVAAEERLDGKFLLATSDPDTTAEDVALGYKHLLEAEGSFRELKGSLRLHQILHRLEERIRAHILICWLALLLVQLRECQAQDTWRKLRRELEWLHLVTLAGAAGKVQQTTGSPSTSATSSTGSGSTRPAAHQPHPRLTGHPARPPTRARRTRGPTRANPHKQAQTRTAAGDHCPTSPRTRPSPAEVGCNNRLKWGTSRPVLTTSPIW